MANSMNGTGGDVLWEEDHEGNLSSVDERVCSDLLTKGDIFRILLKIIR